MSRGIAFTKPQYLSNGYNAVREEHSRGGLVSHDKHDGSALRRPWRARERLPVKPIRQIMEQKLKNMQRTIMAAVTASIMAIGSSTAMAAVAPQAQQGLAGSSPQFAQIVPGSATGARTDNTIQLAQRGRRGRGARGARRGRGAGRGGRRAGRFSGRGRRGGYRRRGRGGRWVGPAIGAGIAAIIGGSIAASKSRYDDRWERCDNRYRSFRWSDGTFQPYGGGGRKLCPYLRY